MTGPRNTEAVESGHVVAMVAGFSDDGTARTLTARYDSSPCVDRGPDVVGTLRAHHPGTAGVQSDTDHIVVAQDTNTYVANIYGGNKRKDRPEGGFYVKEEPTSKTLDAASGLNPTCSQGGTIISTYPINTQLGLRGPDVSNSSRDGLGIGDEEDPAYTLQANHTHAVAYDAAHAFKVRGGCEGGGKGYLGSDEVAFTLSTNQDQHIFSEPAIAWSEELTASVDLAGTIQRGGSGGRHDGVMVPSEAFQPTADCLTAAYGTKWNGNASATNGSLFAQQQSTVRRLTPVECERLQGFPDNFTAIPWGKKEAADCPDGPRYKALGNSMAVPVMRWIGERIRYIDDYISII